MKKYILIFYIILFLLFISILFGCDNPAINWPVYSGQEDNTPTKYTITYDANGATSGTVPMDNQSYEYLKFVNILGNTGNLARTGYYFAGWNTKSDGTGESYIVDDRYIITSNTTLYAEWVSNNVADAPSLMKYLKANFGILQTSIGQTKFKFDYYENTTITSPYDYWIKVGYDFDFFYDLQYSNRISTEMNHTVCQELKDHQERIARAAIDKMPNKKMKGGYFTSGWLYPYIYEGYYSYSYYSWKNYTIGNIGSSEYDKSKITGFEWDPLIDDHLER